MASNGKLEARLTVPTGGWAFSVTDTDGGPTATTIPAGTYYHSSNGSNANTLAEAFVTAADAAIAGSGAAWSCSVAAGEDGTGKYTISATGGTCTVTFTETALRDLMGFTGNLSGSTSYTGADQAEGLWIASQGHQVKNATTGGGWVTDQQTVNTASGHVYSVMGRKYRRSRIVWPMETRAKCWVENEATTNESFEQFYLDSILGGAVWGASAGPVRFYPDADTDATFGTYSVLGLESWDPSELQEHWAAGHWIIELPNLIEVPS